MELFEEQKKLIDAVTKATSKNLVVSEFKIIWGQRTGKDYVIEKLVDAFDVLIFTQSSIEGKVRFGARPDIHGYGTAPGDITLMLENLKKFSKVPDIIVLRDLDWSGLSTREVSGFMFALREACGNNGVSTILILTSYNKPSITESLFGGTGVCQKLATWEVNAHITKESLADNFRAHEALALRDFGCE